MSDGIHDPDGMDDAIRPLGLSEGISDGIDDPEGRDGAMSKLGISEGMMDGIDDPDGAVSPLGLADIRSNILMSTLRSLGSAGST